MNSTSRILRGYSFSRSTGVKNNLYRTRLHLSWGTTVKNNLYRTPLFIFLPFSLPFSSLLSSVLFPSLFFYLIPPCSYFIFFRLSLLSSLFSPHFSLPSSLFPSLFLL